MGAKPRYCEERGGREGGREKGRNRRREGGRKGGIEEGRERREGEIGRKKEEVEKEIITLRKEDNDLRIYKETSSEVIFINNGVLVVTFSCPAVSHI